MTDRPKLRSVRAGETAAPTRRQRDLLMPGYRWCRYCQEAVTISHHWRTCPNRPKQAP
jgi:hypothetical protein